jgi:hypothetical protein
VARPATYQLTEERRRLLLRHYGHMNTWDLLRLPAFHSLPGEPRLLPKTLYNWAYRLGVSGDAPARWTEADELLLEENWTTKPKGWIARKLKRSEPAVKERARKLNLEQGYYTPQDVSANLGIGVRVVLRWEAEGLLKADAGPHKYTRGNLADMFIDCPFELFRLGVYRSSIRVLWMDEVKAIRIRSRKRQSPKGKAS